MREGQQEALLQKLEEMNWRAKHPFPGTVARNVLESETIPCQVENPLVWRGTMMLDEAARELALESFQQVLADTLGWITAQYNKGKDVDARLNLLFSIIARDKKLM